jgi:uncharacterized protein
MTTATAPATGRDRLTELDVIRGFALFGVLWMNLYEHADLAMAPGVLEKLPTAAIDKWVGYASTWLMQGKAQALFSFLFGLGFALFLDRAEKRSTNGTWLYVRRIGFLLVLGFAHALLLWLGDILNAYAMMGLLLVFTRRLPGWALLALGALLCFSTLGLRLYGELTLAPGQAPWWRGLAEQGAVRRYPVFMGQNYGAYVRELWSGNFDELYLTPIGPVYLGWILGRFMIGSWIYRQGWLQDTARYAAGFRRAAAILLPLGLAISAFGLALHIAGIKIPRPWNWSLSVLGPLGLYTLALGYAAGLVVLCQRPAWRRRLAGLGAAGQMALTNYLTQSLLYFFLLYGFGLGLLPYAGATFCLVLAVLFYGAQIAFSRWWLARYRFGPVEWLWRSFTYGSRQPMRRVPEEAALPA